jgi:soluble lytic murein transglycosylase-like protein
LRRFCFRFGPKAGLLVLAVCGGLSISGLQASDALTSVVRADPRSGKLVRVVLPAAPRGSSANAALSSAVDRIAAEHALPPELIHSVIKIESNYNPFAISPKGALGIMQLVPETARRFGVSNAFNAEENIQGGAKYLKYLLDLYHGDYPLALAAYNAGEAAVARHGGVPPYPETRNYVEGVRKQLQRAAEAKASDVERESLTRRPAIGAEDGVPEHNPIRQIVEPDGSVRYVSR